MYLKKLRMNDISTHRPNFSQIGFLGVTTKYVMLLPYSNVKPNIVDIEKVLLRQSFRDTASPKKNGAHKLQASPNVLLRHFKHFPVIESHDAGSSGLMFPEQLQG